MFLPTLSDVDECRNSSFAFTCSIPPDTSDTDTPQDIAPGIRDAPGDVSSFSHVPDRMIDFLFRPPPFPPYKWRYVGCIRHAIVRCYLRRTPMARLRPRSIAQAVGTVILLSVLPRFPLRCRSPSRPLVSRKVSVTAVLRDFQLYTFPPDMGRLVLVPRVEDPEFLRALLKPLTAVPALGYHTVYIVKRNPTSIRQNFVLGLPTLLLSIMPYTILRLRHVIQLSRGLPRWLRMPLSIPPSLKRRYPPNIGPHSFTPYFQKNPPSLSWDESLPIFN